MPISPVLTNLAPRSPAPTALMATNPAPTALMATNPVPTSPLQASLAPIGAVATGAAPIGIVAASPAPISVVATSPAPIGVVATGAAPASPGRLTRRAEFLRVAAKGRKAPMPGLVLQALKRDDNAPARLGFTVTKKVGNAVIRNRTRRRLKEAARLLLRDQPVAGADLVLIGRDATRSRDFAALQADLRRALGKAGVL